MWPERPQKKSTMIEGLFSKMEIPQCNVHKKKIQTRIKRKMIFIYNTRNNKLHYFHLRGVEGKQNT